MKFLKDNIRDKWDRFKHILLLLYFPFYLAVFGYLEDRSTRVIHIISCPLDEYIPFLPVFIIPYLFWFVYLLFAGLYLLFFEKEVFSRMMYFGIIGMTIFLVVSWLWPNGLDIRPTVLTGNDIFVRLTKYVYSVDTSTNVLPSIHVFNSVGACIALRESNLAKKHPSVRHISFVASALIILSTMFVKQHSVVDVMAGLVLSYITYDLVYNGGLLRIRNVSTIAKYRGKQQV
ncbi:MAG: phosphatase PAP2 family protein [Clostridiales bacterium]|nr:phosphatase PAP2 family protein [Clostridiales bacterium]